MDLSSPGGPVAFIYPSAKPLFGPLSPTASRDALHVLTIWLVVRAPLVEFLSMRYLDKEVMETKLFAGPARDVSVNQLTRVLGQFFVTTFKARLNLRDYRHLMTYIIRHWVAKDKVHLLSPRVKRTMQLHEGPAPRPHRIDDQLAGHTTSIANRFYARDKNLFRNKTRDVTDRSLEFCEAYFEFFGLESAREVEDIVAAERITSSVHDQHLGSLSGIDLPSDPPLLEHAEGHIFYGSAAGFHPWQYYAYLRKCHPLSLAALLTGL